MSDYSNEQQWCVDDHADSYADDDPGRDLDNLRRDFIDAVAQYFASYPHHPVYAAARPLLAALRAATFEVTE